MLPIQKEIWSRLDRLRQFDFTVKRDSDCFGTVMIYARTFGRTAEGLPDVLFEILDCETGTLGV